MLQNIGLSQTSLKIMEVNQLDRKQMKVKMTILVRCGNKQEVHQEMLDSQMLLLLKDSMKETTSKKGSKDNLMMQMGHL